MIILTMFATMIGFIVTALLNLGGAPAYY